MLGCCTRCIVAGSIRGLAIRRAVDGFCHLAGLLADRERSRPARHQQSAIDESRHWRRNGSSTAAAIWGPSPPQDRASLNDAVSAGWRCDGVGERSSVPARERSIPGELEEFHVERFRRRSGCRSQVSLPVEQSAGSVTWRDSLPIVSLRNTTLITSRDDVPCPESCFLKTKPVSAGPRRGGLANERAYPRADRLPGEIGSSTWNFKRRSARVYRHARRSRVSPPNKHLTGTVTWRATSCRP